MRVIFAVVLCGLICPRAGTEETASSAATRQTVFYSGHVQGVGFRSTTEQLARDFKVRGWVKNLEDGRVQLVVEGERKELEGFLAAVTRRFYNHIQKQEIQSSPATGEFLSFEIRQ